MKALVTGGSAGLGAAMVRQFLDEGAEVVSIDIAVGEPVSGLTFLQCDLADREAVDATIPRIVASGPFDLTIFNAGISATGKFEEIPVEAHLRLLQINAEAPMIMAAALAGSGAMNQGSGMSFVSSLSHFTGYPGAASYAASKDALAIYAKSVRKSFAKKGIVVSAIFPGPLRTDHAERYAPPGADASKRQTPEEAASEILAAIRSGKRSIFPGRATRLIAVSGRLLPRVLTGQMRKLIFEKLEKPVW